MSKVAILGANGRLGRVVGKAFLDAGYEVIAITRTGEIPAELAGAQNRAADAMKKNELIDATRGVDVVFNALNPLYTQWKQICIPLAQNVVAACEANYACHLFPGNVYNFGSPMPAELKEEDSIQPSSRKGQIRVEMERIFADAANQRGVQTILLRAGDFFGGTGTGSWFDQAIASKVSKGVFTYPGNPDIVHEWAYLPDLARAFVALAEKHDVLDRYRAFHFPGHAITGREMLRATEMATGQNLKLAGIPWWLLRLAGVVLPMWREVSEMSYLWNEPHQLKSDSLESVIGPIPHTPLESAIAKALGDIGISNARPRPGTGVAPAAA